MLKRYFIELEDNNINKERYFLDSLNSMNRYRELSKDWIPHFFGMRNTWFPLVILRLTTVNNMTDGNIVRNAEDMFSKYVNEKGTHSWYFIESFVSTEDCPDGYGGAEYDTNVILFKAKEEDIKKMNEYLKPIMKMFGLRYKLRYAD